MSYGASAYSPIWESMAGYARPQYIKSYKKFRTADELALSFRNEFSRGLVLYLPFVRFVPYRADTITRVFDRSPFSNHGTIIGAVWHTLPNGKSVLSCDGVDDYIVILNSTSLNPTDAITVAAWVKPSYFSGTGSDPIVDKAYYYHGGRFYQYHLFLVGYAYYKNPGRYGFSISIGGTLRELNSGEDLYDVDKWNFIVGTYDGEAIKLYRNGVLTNMVEGVFGQIDTYSTNLFIARFRNLVYCLPVVIGELRIYNRALSESENRRLFNLTRVFYGV